MPLINYKPNNLGIFIYNKYVYELMKEDDDVGDLSEKLIEELECETVFTIPLLGGINVSESVVVTWIIMLVLVIFSVLLTADLKIENPGRRQLAVESAVTGIQDLVKGFVGSEGKRYVFYLMTVIIYIGVSNIIGIFGFKPPTKDLMVTGALSIMSIVLVQYAGIRARKVGGWLKGFTEPVWIVTPINILELVIRPLSLCMRLFGNILGAFVVMELIKNIIPVGLPMAASLYFDIFDGLIQAYIFVFLTGLFIKEAIE